jgi:fructose-bisphosphate aldolase class II
MVQQAIAHGVCKVNVNTECQLAFAAAIRQYIEDKKDLDTKAKGFDPRKLLKPGIEAIKNKCIEKFKVFSSIGKA